MHMTEDYSELISYLDKRFSSIETVLEKKADKSDIRELINAIDGLSKQLETYFHEMRSMQLRMDRIEKTIAQLADHTGFGLDL